MLDTKIHQYVAKRSERKTWSAIGVRRLIRESSLSQKTVYKILAGDPVRRHTLSSFRQSVMQVTVT
jgi:hypothetical protein